MGPGNNITYLFQHVADVIGKQTDQLLQKEVGIGLSQYRILMVLEWNPRVTQNAIALSLGQTEASISRQIKVLEKSGLLATKPDPLNRRKHIATPTPKGAQATEAASTLLRRSTGAEFGALDEASLNGLYDTLHRLHKNICRQGKTGACNHQLGF
jgi:DNA-binding MarR family transcriptional regulator